MLRRLLGFSSLLLIVLLSACQMNMPSSNLLYGQPSDEVLTQRVQRSLYLSDDPVVANLHAESIQGTVVLTGFVKKIKQSDEAQQIAQSTAGVAAVKNNIIVRP